MFENLLTQVGCSSYVARNLRSRHRSHPFARLHDGRARRGICRPLIWVIDAATEAFKSAADFVGVDIYCGWSHQWPMTLSSKTTTSATCYSLEEIAQDDQVFC